MPSRRALLRASAGATAVLAGCTGGYLGAETESATATETPAPMGATQQVGDAEVTVSRSAVQSSVLYWPHPDSMNARAADGWYVFVRVDAGGDSPDSAAFELLVDGEGYASTEVGYKGFMIDGSSAYPFGDDRDEGWLAFDVSPTASVADLRVTVGDAAWRLPDRISDGVSRPSPIWKLESLDVPAKLHPGEAFDVVVEVENVGDVEATFRGSLNVAHLNYGLFPYWFGVDVAAGERGSWTKSLSVPDDADGEVDPDFRLRTEAGDLTSEADIVAETPTPTPD